MSDRGFSALERARALQAAAICLQYPDERMRGHAGLLAAVADALPPGGQQPLRRFVSYLTAPDGTALTRVYVDTFDLRRRCCLYLTYYAHGDTRKRGMALLRFTTGYRNAGVALTGDELPDHLGVVCEVAARYPDVGLELLRDNRAGVELLRLALDNDRSPYVDVLDLIRAALPDPSPRDLAQALELARSGPPAEEVGLEPFAPPEYMGARR